MKDSSDKSRIDNDALDEREQKLIKRKEKLDAMEAELKSRQKSLAASEAKRKQIVLRLPESLWADIARWAEDDFRSVNAQIEYLLTKCVKERK